MIDRLKKLSALAEMVKDAELAKQSKIAAERRQIQTQRDETRARRTEVLPAGEAGPAHHSGNAAHWPLWCKAEIARLSAQEAKVAAAAETQKQISSRAFGRASVLSELIKRETAKLPKP